MTGRSPSGRATHERSQSSLSPPSVSVPNADALENLGAIPANFHGNVNASIAISLKRIADMMEEDRKPRLELMPEGYIGEQEHRRFMRDTFLRDVNAWETLADAATYIAGRMPLPASCDRSGEAGETTKIGSTEGESAVPEGQTPNDHGDSSHD